MPTARDLALCASQPAAFRRRTLIGTCAGFRRGLGIAVRMEDVCVPEGCNFTIESQRWKSASMAILQHQNANITGIAEAVCHPAEGIRIVMRDVAAASRRNLVVHSSA